MNSKYKDCQYYFDGRCRCMDFSYNQDFYECPQCEDDPYCYYKQLKEREQELAQIKEACKYKEALDEIKKWNKDIREVIEGAEE